MNETHKRSLRRNGTAADCRDRVVYACPLGDVQIVAPAGIHLRYTPIHGADQGECASQGNSDSTLPTKPTTRPPSSRPTATHRRRSLMSF